MPVSAVPAHRIPNEGRRSSPEQRRTLWMASLSALLVLITVVTPLGTGIRTAATLQTGLGGQAWLPELDERGTGRRPPGGGRAGRRLRTPAGVHRRPRPRRAGRRDGGGRRFDRCVRRGPRAAGRGAAAVLASALGLIGHAFAVGPARSRAAAVRGASAGAGTGLGGLPPSSSTTVKAGGRRTRSRRRSPSSSPAQGGSSSRARGRPTSRRPPGHHSPGRRPDAARRTGGRAGRLDPADDGGTPDRRPAAPGGFLAGAALGLAAHRRPDRSSSPGSGRHPRGIRDRRRTVIGLASFLHPAASAGSGTPSSSSPSGSSSGQR